MAGEKKSVVAGFEAEKASADQRTADQVKWRDGLVMFGVIEQDLTVRGRVQGQVLVGNREFHPRCEAQTKAIRNNDGTKSIVTIYDILKRGTQGVFVERPADIQSKGLVE